MIDTETVNKLVSSGLCFICALCEHYHKALDNNRSKCGMGCCGPLYGGIYKKYKGQLTDDSFKNFCFICGKDSTKHIEIEVKEGIKTQIRLFGLCNEHIKIFRHSSEIAESLKRNCKVTQAK